MDSQQIETIKDIAKELLQKMTIDSFTIEAKTTDPLEDGSFFSSHNNQSGAAQEVVMVNITLQEPQFLIGQNGQTLFDLQRVFKMMVNKKIQSPSYVSMDINGYKAKKIDYLKRMAKELADEVVATKEKKILPPMSSYERRAIHMELSKRQDVIGESQGEGDERRVVISPK